MKVNKKRAGQFEIAQVLFEMGLDFDLIEKVSKVSPQELLLNQVNLIDFEDEINDNNQVLRTEETE